MPMAWARPEPTSPSLTGPWAVKGAAPIPSFAPAFASRAKPPSNGGPIISRPRGVSAEKVAERDGRLTLDFEDFEGQRLSLVNDEGTGETHPWEESPIAAENQIRGLGPITLSVPELRSTEVILTTVMNMTKVREFGEHQHVFKMNGSWPRRRTARPR